MPEGEILPDLYCVERKVSQGIARRGNGVGSRGEGVLTGWSEHRALLPTHSLESTKLPFPDESVTAQDADERRHGGGGGDERQNDPEEQIALPADDDLIARADWCRRPRSRGIR